jgi:hypothetical protein
MDDLIGDLEGLATAKTASLEILLELIFRDMLLATTRTSEGGHRFHLLFKPVKERTEVPESTVSPMEGPRSAPSFERVDPQVQTPHVSQADCMFRSL